MSMKQFFVAVACVGLAGSAYADMQAAGKNLDDQRAAIVAFFDALAASPHDTGAYGQGPNFYGEGTGTSTDQPQDEVVARVHVHVRVKKGLDWADAGSTPYKQNMTMDAMTTIGMTAAQSIGTACQAQEASILASYSQELAGNSNAQLQQESGLMASESTAVAAGDQASANSYVSAEQALPQASLAGYDPTSSDIAWGQDMSSVGEQVVASAATALSSAAVTALVQGLACYFGSCSSGSTSSSTSSAFISSFASSLSRNLASSGSTNSINAGSLAGSNGMSLGGVNLGSGLGGGQLAAPMGGSTGLGAPMANPGGGNASNISVQNAPGAAAGGALPAAAP